MRYLRRLSCSRRVTNTCIRRWVQLAATWQRTSGLIACSALTWAMTRTRMTHPAIQTQSIGSQAGRRNCVDARGDDEIEIHIDATGAVTVRYVTMSTTDCG